MLFSVLILVTFCLSGFTASASKPDSYSRTLSLAQSHTLNVPCRQCAFSHGNCPEKANGSASLAVTFRTEDDTLLANDYIIFPPSAPFIFNALYESDSGSKRVSVPYVLGFRGLYQLEITLVDVQDRPATQSPVSIFLFRRKDERLVIIGIDSSQYKWDPYRLVQNQDSNTTSSWMRKTGKSTYIASAKLASAWTGKKDFLQLVGPAIMPALLGVAAGMLALLVGFFVGCAMYYWCCEIRKRRADSPKREVEVALAFEK